MSERAENDSEVLEKQRRLLRVYRSVSKYTISAVEGAIDNLMDAIAVERDEDMKNLLSERLKTLESSLEIMTQDYE